MDPYRKYNIHYSIILLIMIIILQSGLNGGLDTSQILGVIFALCNFVTLLPTNFALFYSVKNVLTFAQDEFAFYPLCSRNYAMH